MNPAPETPCPRCGETEWSGVKQWPNGRPEQAWMHWFCTVCLFHDAAMRDLAYIFREDVK